MGIIGYDRQIIYLRIAMEISKHSNDPSSKFGAIIINPETGAIISSGHNGFPPGIIENERMLDRAIKYEYVVHAETRAIINAHQNLAGKIMFINGLPCCRCAVNIIEAGIKTVVILTPSADYLSRWADSVQHTRDVFKEAGVKLTKINL